jgi:hypothetical protein
MGGEVEMNLLIYLIFCADGTEKYNFLCHSRVVPFFTGKGNCFKSDRNTMNFIQ